MEGVKWSGRRQSPQVNAPHPHPTSPHTVYLLLLRVSISSRPQADKTTKKAKQTREPRAARQARHADRGAPLAADNSPPVPAVRVNVLELLARCRLNYAAAARITENRGAPTPEPRAVFGTPRQPSGPGELR